MFDHVDVKYYCLAEIDLWHVMYLCFLSQEAATKRGKWQRVP